MVDWDKELKEAKLRLLKRVYLEAMKKIEGRLERKRSSMAYYLLSDNYDEGLELESLETEEELGKYLNDPDWGDSNRRRLMYVIEGKELDLAEVLDKYGANRA